MSVYGNTKHGMHGTPTYSTYAAMITRCTNPNQKSWKRYGGRGIRVCERWRNSFKAFLADMGERPSGMTLDRIDSNGNYCPENCRWATRKEQCRNTSRNKFVEYKGEHRTVSEWAELLGHDPVNLNRRLTRGWPVKLAMELPNGPSGCSPRLTYKQEAVLYCLAYGRNHVSDFVERAMTSRKSIDDCLLIMKKRGMIRSIGVGLYEATGTVPHQSISLIEAELKSLAVDEEKPTP